MISSLRFIMLMLRNVLSVTTVREILHEVFQDTDGLAEIPVADKQQLLAAMSDLNKLLVALEYTTDMLKQVRDDHRLRTFASHHLAAYMFLAKITPAVVAVAANIADVVDYLRSADAAIDSINRSLNPWETTVISDRTKLVVYIRAHEELLHGIAVDSLSWGHWLERLSRVDLEDRREIDLLLEYLEK